MIKIIKDIREKGLKLMDEGLESLEAGNHDTYKTKWAQGKAHLDIAKQLAEENNINLNEYCNKYGKMYLTKVKEVH